MVETRLNALHRLWTPGGGVEGRALTFLRVTLITAVVSASMWVLLPVLFLSALLLHNRTLGLAGIFVLGVGMAGFALREAASLWWVMQLGRWAGWTGKPISRLERPVRFWTYTALHAAIFAIYAAAAVFLIWNGLAMN